MVDLVGVATPVAAPLAADVDAPPSVLIVIDCLLLDVVRDRMRPLARDAIFAWLAADEADDDEADVDDDGLTVLSCNCMSIM